ncbi:MAG: PAS domain S-box protein [Cyanobacteria bacterium J06638_22]
MAQDHPLPSDGSQTLLQAWVEHTPVAIAILDSNFRYQMVSRRWQDDHGLGDCSPIGKSHLSFFPHDTERWVEMLQRGMSGETVLWEGLNSRPDGQQDWLRWTVYPWGGQNQDTISGLTVVSEIITERKQAEEERDRFFQLLPDMLCVADFQGNFRQVNPAWEQVLGFRVEELIGQPFMDWVHPDDQAATQTVAQSMVVGASVTAFENRYRCKDGSYRWFSWQAIPCLETHRIYATARDITDLKQTNTDLKQANTDLKETKRFLESVLNCLPVAVMAKEVNKFRYALWNPAAEVILKREAADVLGKTAWDLFPAPEAKALAEQDQTVLQAGKMLDFPEMEVPVNPDEHRILHTKKTIIFDAHEQPQYLLAIAEDVSERRQAERQLQEQEQFLRSIYDGVEQQIFVIDVMPDGQFLCAGWNRMAEQVVGESYEAFLGRPACEVYKRQDEAETALQRFKECVRLGISITYEEQLTFQGTETWWLTTLNPLRDESGQIYRLVGTSLDISERKRVEYTLREKQTFIEQMANNSPGILYIYDVEQQRNVYCNRAISETLGYSTVQVEVMGETFLEQVLHPEDLPWIQRHLQTMQGLADGQTCELEYRMRRADDTWVWLYSRETVFRRDRAGQVTQILGIAQDITDRKTAEAALLTSQQRLSLLIQQTPLGVIEWTPEGHVQAWNPAAAKIFGYTPEEAMGQHFGFLIQDELKGQVAQIFVELLAQSGGTRSINANRTRDGHEILCEWYNTPLVAPNGETIGIASLVHDVTDRVAAETALQEREERLRSINTSVPGVIYQYQVNLETGEECITYMSPRAVELFEFEPQILMTHPEVLWALVHPDDLQRYQESAAIAVQNQLPWFDEFRIITPSGTMKWLQAQSEPSAPVGHLSIHNGVMIDISERKAAEAALQASEAELRHALAELQRTQMRLIQGEKMSSLGQLVAGVAHEINNPVNFIYGNLSHAKNYTQDLLSLIQLYQLHYPDPVPAIAEAITAVDLDFVSEDLPKLINSMKFGADRIRDIVASLRTFSRMDEVTMKAVNLHDGLDSTLVILNNRIRAQEDRPAITVIRNYGHLPPVKCHAGQMNQVFMNLISNAIDALEEWCRRAAIADDCDPYIEIETKVLTPQSCAQIIITDNGSGIPDPIRQRIFDPFFTTKPVGKGTGMGLSISYQIITETHGGTLECYSHPNAGTRFVIQIPLKLQEQQEKVRQEKV